ncbi:hypothetical protein GCM10010420_42180 [Streptomyces glaucosporus]|uniref:Uncharacterized protein n=1 Tax=Streptomyces glaucosporus TaxID=284044 RepID=A0ABN3IMJ2_9ACTN
MTAPDEEGRDHPGTAGSADGDTEFEEWLRITREPGEGLGARLSSELESHLLGEAI